MRTILFIDSVAYKPYNYSTLANEPLGGSEATLLRVARLLARHGDRVYVLSQAEPHETDFGVRFISPTCQIFNPTHVVHFRTARLLPNMQAAYPYARHLVWHQDLGGIHTKPELELYAQCPDTRLVFVSNYHKQQFIDRGVNPFTKEFKHGGLNVCYNLVEAQPQGLTVDYNKLIFPSSPHKGLKQTVHLFEAVRREFPDMVLYVANPGYLDTQEMHQENIRTLGALPNHKVLAHMETSLCLFSGNHVFSETYGIVFSEANAVGTPCLAHPFGAMNEILTPNELIDTRSPAKVVEYIVRLKSSRPRASCFALARDNKVIKQWETALD